MSILTKGRVLCGRAARFLSARTAIPRILPRLKLRIRNSRITRICADLWAAHPLPVVGAVAMVTVCVLLKASNDLTGLSVYFMAGAVVVMAVRPEPNTTIVDASIAGIELEGPPRGESGPPAEVRSEGPTVKSLEAAGAARFVDAWKLVHGLQRGSRASALVGLGGYEVRLASEPYIDPQGRPVIDIEPHLDWSSPTADIVIRGIFLADVAAARPGDPDMSDEMIAELARIAARNGFAESADIDPSAPRLAEERAAKSGVLTTNPLERIERSRREVISFAAVIGDAMKKGIPEAQDALRSARYHLALLEQAASDMRRELDRMAREPGRA